MRIASGGTPRAIIRSGWQSRTAWRHAARTVTRSAPGQNAQHRPRVRPCVRHETGAYRPEPRLGELEGPRNDIQEVVLGRMVMAVRHGDVEQAFQEVAEHLAVVAEHRADAAGVVLEPRHVLSGKVIDPCRGLLLALGNHEDLAERRHLVARHPAVGLGHLRAEGNHRDGEGDRALGRRSQPVEHRRQPLAGGERRERVGDAGPERHGSCLAALAAARNANLRAPRTVLLPTSRPGLYQSPSRQPFQLLCSPNILGGLPLLRHWSERQWRREAAGGRQPPATFRSEHNSRGSQGRDGTPGRRNCRPVPECRCSRDVPPLRVADHRSARGPRGVSITARSVGSGPSVTLTNGRCPSAGNSQRSAFASGCTTSSWTSRRPRSGSVSAGCAAPSQLMTAGAAPS